MLLEVEDRPTQKYGKGEITKIIAYNHYVKFGTDAGSGFPAILSREYFILPGLRKKDQKK